MGSSSSLSPTVTGIIRRRMNVSAYLHTHIIPHYYTTVYDAQTTVMSIDSHYSCSDFNAFA